MNLDKDQLSGRIQVVVTKRAMIIIDVATLRVEMQVMGLKLCVLLIFYIGG
jgi:hypothetical protein